MAVAEDPRHGAMTPLLGGADVWAGVPYDPERLFWTLLFMLVAVGGLVAAVRVLLRGSVLADVATTLGIFLVIIGTIVYTVAFRGLRTGELVVGWLLSGAVIAWVLYRLNQLARRPVRVLEEVGDAIRRGDWHAVMAEGAPAAGASFSAALAQVGSLIAETQRATERVQQAAAQAAHIGHEVREGAGRTSAAVDTVKASSAHAADATGQIAEASGRLSGSAQTVHNAASETLEISHGAEERVQRGVQTAATASTTISSLAGAARDLAQRMSELRGATDTVAEIALAVSSISDQTKLLALNASIEAARAGEHGAGFAVVADEVGKLATESATSLSRIEEFVRQMTERASHAEQAALQVENGSAQGDELMQQTVGLLREIEAQLQRTRQLAGNVVQASRQQTELAGELGVLAGSIVQAARSAASSSEDAAAVSARQLALTDDLTATAATLEDTAGSLVRVVARFGARS